MSDLQKFGLISGLVTAFTHNVLVSKITLASFCLTSACAQWVSHMLMYFVHHTIPVLCWFKQALRELKVERAHNNNYCELSQLYNNFYYYYYCINLQAPYGLHPMHISTCNFPDVCGKQHFSASFVPQPLSVKSNTFNNRPILLSYHPKKFTIIESRVSH